MLQSNDLSQTSDSEATAAASLQPMGFMDILDTTLSLYRSHCRLILGICAVYFVLMLGMSLLKNISMLFFLSLSGENVTIVLLYFADWILALVSLFYAGAIVFAGAQAYLGNHITAGAAFKQATRRFLPCLGSFLLLILVVMGLTMTIIGIPFAIYFLTRWGFYMQAVIIEGASATHALKRSRELVRGAWWRIFGIILAIILIVCIIQTVLQFFLLFAFGFTQAISGEEGLKGRLEMLLLMFMPVLTGWDGLVAYLIQSCLNHFVTSLTPPLILVAITLLYFDQRIRKEGFGTRIHVTNAAE